MFGKSFNEIGTAIVGRIKDIRNGIQATGDIIGSVRNSKSIRQRLYSSKKDIESQLIDIDKVYPKKDDTQFSRACLKIKNCTEFIASVKFKVLPVTARSRLDDSRSGA